MTTPNFLPNRTQEELQQEVRDIGKALDNYSNAYDSIGAFVKMLSQFAVDPGSVFRSPEFQKAYMKKVAEEQGKKCLSIGGKEYEVADWTMELDNEADQGGCNE